jgi:hypothetical protein
MQRNPPILDGWSLALIGNASVRQKNGALQGRVSHVSSCAGMTFLG